MRTALVGLVVCSCAHAPPVAPAGPPDLDAVAGPPTLCDRTPSTWVDRPTGRDHVRFAAGLEADGDRAEAGLVAARDALAAELAVPSEATAATWVWLTTASDTIHTGVSMARGYGEQVTILAYSPSCGADPRPRQLEKVLFQQLAPGYLGAATAASEPGWAFADGPGWFVKGAGGWVTMLLHAQPEDREGAAREAARLSPEGAIELRDGGVGVADPARDGTALVGWLTLAHGPDVVTRLLASDAATFDLALAEVTGLDGAGVVAGYLAWRAEDR